MGVRLKRLLGPATRLQPGEWTDETVSGREAISCPLCGGISEIAEPHRVWGGGAVRPIWRCETVSCPFMDFIELEHHAEAVLR